MDIILQFIPLAIVIVFWVLLIRIIVKNSKQHKDFERRLRELERKNGDWGGE